MLIRKNYRWILRDLSNGDGADGRPYPTYVWVCSTRDDARNLKRQHVTKNQAELGPIERWSLRRLHPRYTAVAPRLYGVYYHKRD